MNKNYYIGLDALRGVAAMAVVLFHRRWWSADGHLLDHAFLAVDFFFGLSGFVIAHAYQRRLAGGLSLRQFLELRAIRLMPMVMLSGVIAAAFFGYRWLRTGRPVGFETWLAVLANGLALPAPMAIPLEPEAAFPINGPAWSLFFEMCVNILFALMAPRLGRGVLLGLVAASFVALVALTLGSDGGVMHLGNTRADFIAGLPRTTFSFFLGVLLFQIQPAAEGRRRGGLLIPSIILIGSFLPNAGMAYDAWYQLMCICLVYPWLIRWVANMDLSPRQVPLALLAGALSYPIYVLHYPIYYWFETLVRSGSPLRVWIAAVVIVLLSFGALRGIDQPVRSRLSAWRKKAATG